LGAAPTSFPEVVGCGAGGALAAGGERARGARLRLLLLVLLLLRRHLPPLSSPLQEQIRISSFLPRHSCSDSASSPRKIKSLRTPEGTGDKGGRKVDADRTRERGRERRGEERERVCVRNGNGGTEEVGGDRNGGRWGCGVLDETPSPPCTAPTILRPGPGKRGAARHHTRLHRI
jgi:hypothetical protein